MTDKEMAVSLCSYIIRLQQKIKGLEGVLAEYCFNKSYGLVDIPWGEKARQIEQNEYHRQIANAQHNSLRDAIAAENQGSALIRVLHDQFGQFLEAELYQ